MTGLSNHRKIKLEDLDTTLLSLRITRPKDLARVRQSLERSGQLNPIVVRPLDDRFQILDGFKRYVVAGDLGWESLEARIPEVSLPEGKAAMLSYNRSGRILETHYMKKAKQLGNQEVDPQNHGSLPVVEGLTEKPVK